MHSHQSAREKEPFDAQAARTISRDDLLRLGQSGRPWRFLPLGAQALRIAPDDAGIRLLMASNFARLGLRSAAIEQIEALPAAAAADPAVGQLRSALDSIAEDILDPAERIETAWLNVQALRRRDVDLTDAFSEWRGGVNRTRFMRASDGSIVRRRTDRPIDDAGAWDALLGDGPAVRKMTLPHTPGARIIDPSAPAPYLIEGVDPPSLLRRIFDETPPGPDGYQPIITVVQADCREALEGLSLMDLGDIIEAPRVRFAIGAGAAESLRLGLEDRMSTQINGALLRSPLLRTPLAPSVESICEDAIAAQGQLTRDLRRQVDEAYAGRNAAWWATRFARREEEPLRVLIPTSRYTTFVRHSAEDLAGALRRLGCETRLVMEPDHHSRLTAPAHLHAFADWEPDMVVLINYTRAQLSNVCPANVPFVCWVQDAMAHLFDEAGGAAQGDLDFLAGSLFPALFEEFSYPRKRALTMPVVASDTKFFPHESAGRDCEICYVSHQSAPISEFAAQLTQILSGVDRPEFIVDSLVDGLSAATDRFRVESPFFVARSLAIDTLRAYLGEDPEPRLLTFVLNQVAIPLADRVMRHESLEWAASIAHRRGWRLHIHGEGWDRHPTLAKFARSPIEHGDALREKYASAAVHLHVSANTGVHQRIIECALAGGLPLCRLHGGDFDNEARAARIAARRRGPIAAQNLRNHLGGLTIADHPELMMLQRLRSCFGGPARAFEWIGPNLVADEKERRIPAERRLLRLLGDPVETMFTCETDLEVLIERAVERPAWRNATSRMIARRAKDTLTHDVFGRRILDLVSDSLCSTAASNRGPALSAAG